MVEELPSWRDVQEEALRPRQPGDRHGLRVIWWEWPGVQNRRRALEGMTDEEIDWLTRAVLAELATRSEGRQAAARLLVKYGGAEEGAA